MKFSLVKLSLALLSAGFILGCQDQGSGPVGVDGLVPQFVKKGINCEVEDHPSCPKDEEPPPPAEEDATFTANFTGPDVTGPATPLFGPHSRKKSLSGGGVNQPPVSLTFNAFLQAANGYTGAEGANCFPEDVYGGLLSIFQATPGSTEAKIHYNFTGKDKVNGETDIVYALLLRGILDPAEWVPATTEDMATITGGTFEIAPEHGLGAISCKGTGDVDFTVEVVLNSA